MGSSKNLGSAAVVGLLGALIFGLGLGMLLYAADAFAEEGEPELKSFMEEVTDATKKASEKLQADSNKKFADLLKAAEAAAKEDPKVEPKTEPKNEGLKEV